MTPDKSHEVQEPVRSRLRAGAGRRALQLSGGVRSAEDNDG
jgi:hypothetical protein